MAMRCMVVIVRLRCACQHHTGESPSPRALFAPAAGVRADSAGFSGGCVRMSRAPCWHRSCFEWAQEALPMATSRTQVIVAYDFSKPADVALQRAVELACHD